jgi:hypothetical protein
LQAGDEGDTELRGQKWILPIGFLAAPPTRIAENIDIGRPEIESGVKALPPFPVVANARLGRDGDGHLMHQGGIKAGGQAYRLRKDGSGAGDCDAMQGFAPPIIGGYA